MCDAVVNIPNVGDLRRRPGGSEIINEGIECATQMVRPVKTDSLTLGTLIERFEDRTIVV